MTSQQCVIVGPVCTKKAIVYYSQLIFSGSSGSSDELSLQLQRLGQFIEQRQLSGSGPSVEIDDSEMTAHLENVRKALGSQKK